MRCPRCDQSEDDVVEATIKKIEKRVFICKECEAIWFSVDEIAASTIKDYSAYMKGIGMPPLWSELAITER